ncbi:alpha/beta hydrolase [Actinoplanes sp. NPDC048796]|uniref:alpha/beta fold hydrolase n=1 Tax=Actinoplanes sp. NPDC048796 TaxID=3155640 RepID=UPI0033D88C30
MTGHGLHVVQDGPRQGPALLLIHGSGAAASSWDLMVPWLATVCHVIRVDLSGCGQSPPAAGYDVPGQAALVARVLDERGLRGVAVAGHSSGGYVGTALAERRPELVGSLTLIGTGPSMDALRPQPLVLRLLLGPPFGALIWRVRTDAWIRKGIAATAARPVDVPDSVVAGVRGITYRSMRKVLRANTAYLEERTLPERLAVLAVPVLAICGDADPKWDPSAARRYPRVEMMPGVGHLPILEAPEATSKLLLDFVGA